MGRLRCACEWHRINGHCQHSQSVVMCYISCCLLQEPSVFDPSGRPWLKFPRLMRGRTSRLLINVRNNGVMPASARLEMEPHAAFKLLEGPQVRHCVSSICTKWEGGGVACCGYPALSVWQAVTTTC